MNIKVIHHQTNSWVVNQNSGTFIVQSQKLGSQVQRHYTLARRAFVIFFIFVAMDMSMCLSPISIIIPPITVGSTWKPKNVAALKPDLIILLYKLHIAYKGTIKWTAEHATCFATLLQNKNEMKNNVRFKNIVLIADQLTELSLYIIAIKRLPWHFATTEFTCTTCSINVNVTRISCNLTLVSSLRVSFFCVKPFNAAWSSFICDVSSS